MCLPYSPSEFSSRGLKCDCLAWYPWELGRNYPEATKYAQQLGFDSMAVCWIGGDVEGRLNWPHIDRLSAAGRVTRITSDWDETLDTYDVEGSLPGQPWQRCRAKRTSYKTESAVDKHLVTTLEDLLRPTSTLEELEKKFQWRADSYADSYSREPRPWLRFKQKKCDTRSWLAGGHVEYES